MSTNSLEPAPLSPAATRLKTIDEGYFKLESFLNLIAALVILGVMFIGVFQIFGRKLINFPVPGYVDVIEVVMTIFAFISISYTERLGGHIRMEILIGRLKGRVFWAVEIFGVVVAMVIVAILDWYAYDHFLRAWQLGDSTIDAEIPLWPSKLLVPFALTLLLVRLSIELAGFVRLLLHPDAEPLATPHIESVDEQAQHEIDAGLAAEAEKVDLLHRGSSAGSPER